MTKILANRLLSDYFQLVFEYGYGYDNYLTLEKQEKYEEDIKAIGDKIINGLVDGE
jgi:hypothetical protein